MEKLELQKEVQELRSLIAKDECMEEECQMEAFGRRAGS